MPKALWPISLATQLNISIDPEWAFVAILAVDHVGDLIQARRYPAPLLDDAVGELPDPGQLAVGLERIIARVSKTEFPMADWRCWH